MVSKCKRQEKGKRFFMKENKLVANSQPKSLKEILHELQHEKKSVQAWKIFLDKKWLAAYQLKIVRTRTEELVFELQDEGPNAIESTKKILAHEKEVRFWVPGMGVLFSCLIISSTDKELITKYPKFFAHQDRRKSLRLKISTHPVTVSIPMKWQNSTQVSYRDKTPYDISSGGFSFIATKDESVLFKNGLQLQGLMINIDSHPCLVEANVVTIVQISPTIENGLFYESSKICFSFEKIQEFDQVFIESYVATAILSEGEKNSAKIG